MKQSTLVSFVLMGMFFLTTPTVHAHEGHDHAPGIEAPHGGVVKRGKVINLEMVTKGGDVELYPLTKDGQSLDLDKVVMTGTAQAPRKDKKPLTFDRASGAFTTTVDLAGTHRVQLDIEITHDGKKDRFKFQVEK